MRPFWPSHLGTASTASTISEVRRTTVGPGISFGLVRFGTLASAAVVLFGLVACGGSSGSTQPSPTPSDVLAQGYMSQGDTFVMFAQFDSTGPEIAGTLYQASMSPSGTNGVATQSFSFTGSRQGNLIVLAVSGGDQWSATLEGPTLRLRYTDVQGLPEIATLSGSSIDIFDSTVQTERAALAGGSGCTVEYPNHDATVSISGSFGGQQPSQICAAATKQGYVPVRADPSEAITCLVGTWGLNVVVRDTGGHLIGSQICTWVTADAGPTPTWASTPADFY
jgi:hypothetical protein